MTKSIALLMTLMMCIAVSQSIQAQEKEIEEEKIIELKKGKGVIVIQTDGKKGKYRVITDESKVDGKQHFGFRILQDDEDDLLKKSSNKKIQKKRVIKRKSSGDDDEGDDKLPAEVRAALKKHGIDLEDGNVEVDVEKSSDGTRKYKIQSSSKDGDSKTKKVIEIQIRDSGDDDDSDSKLKKRVQAKDGVYRLQLKNDVEDEKIIRVRPKFERVDSVKPIRQIQMVSSAKELEKKVDRLDRRMKNIEKKLDQLLKKLDK